MCLLVPNQFQMEAQRFLPRLWGLVEAVSWTRASRSCDQATASPQRSGWENSSRLQDKHSQLPGDRTHAIIIAAAGLGQSEII